jgi:hypothetical protein
MQQVIHIARRALSNFDRVNANGRNGTVSRRMMRSAASDIE